MVLPAEPSQHLFSPLCSKTGSDKCRECSNWSLSTFNDHFLCCSLINFSQAPVVLALADSFELRTLLCDHVSNPIRQREYVFPTLCKRKKASRKACSRPLPIEKPCPVTDMALEEKLGCSCIYSQPEKAW